MSAGFIGEARNRTVIRSPCGGLTEWLCNLRTSFGSPYLSKAKHLACS